MSDILQLPSVCNSHRMTDLVTMGARNDLQRDWSSLLPELLNLIVKNLDEIIGFVRFRAVCMAWRSSTSITDLPQQFPWIFEGCGYLHQSDLRFYSVHFNKIYNIHTPKSSEKRSVIPVKEYLFVYPSSDNQGVSVLNNYGIPFPPCACGGFPCWSRHHKIKKGEHVICYGFDGCDSNSKSYCSRLDQATWRALQIGFNFYNCTHFLLKNMIFFVDNHTGVTKVLDTTTGKLTHIVPAPEGHLARGRVYLVEASDDILRVYQHVTHTTDFDCTFAYDVHRLVVSETSSWYWVKVEDISDHTIFIDSFSAFTVRANDLAGIRANCIYFLKEIYDYERIPSRVLKLWVVETIGIKTDAREQFPCPLKGSPRWFVPNLLNHKLKFS